MLTHNPSSPSRDQAKHAAERIARALRAELPEYTVRVDENIRSRFHVIVEVPFRSEFRTWEEREAAKEEADRA